jgi:LuxR family maltose regulon positive regulatory protein
MGAHKSIPLLTTKFHIQPVRRNIVRRPNLIDRLNAGLNRKLTLISAPAGFGKTTLISEWAERLQASSLKANQIVDRIAWLSLDDSDNDYVRFLTYFIGALQSIGAEYDPTGSIGKATGELLRMPEPPPEEIMTALLNRISALQDGIIVILDDYHYIETEAIHGALTFLVEHMAPEMHLVISTRQDPPLALARLRAEDAMTELRAADLRFSLPEVGEFMNQTMNLDLSTKDITLLEARTEGWIAGLQLAAISLQGRDDAAALIESFTSSHRHVTDYLLQEILNRQSEKLLMFLLQTAILDRLTGPLCDALTGRDDGQEVLETLEHTNLFIVPLDSERRWYRYHHLFAGLLRQRLQHTQPEEIPILHNRASEWCKKNGFFDEAIQYALQADDFEQAVRLIEEHVDVIWQRGEHAKLWRWLKKLPIELVFSKPLICIFHAWYLFHDGQLDAAERSLQAAEQVIGSGTESAAQIGPEVPGGQRGADRLKIQGRVATIRACLSSYRSDVPMIIHDARKALECLPEQDLTWRSLTVIVLGDALFFTGDMRAAYKAQYEAVQACKAAAHTYYIMVAHLKLAITLRFQGRLQRTIEICRQQMQFADENGLSQTKVVGWLLTIWSDVLAELNDLQGAIERAKKGVELVEGSGDMAKIGWSYLFLIRVLFACGDITGAEAIIRKMENVAREPDVLPGVSNLIAGWQIRIWLVQGKLEAASQWMAEHGLNADRDLDSPHGMGFFPLFEHIVTARILISQGRLDKATALLECLLVYAERGERTTKVIEILLLQALALQAADDLAESLARLERALSLAEPEGFIRIFVDEGPQMARLLYEAAIRGIAPDYAQRLLAAFPVAAPEQPAESKIPGSDLIEPLSERELEVLQLIGDGLSNQDVGEKLFISLHTVKAHTRNIYGKIGAHSRTEAVAKARAFGILPSR